MKYLADVAYSKKALRKIRHLRNDSASTTPDARLSPICRTYGSTGAPHRMGAGRPPGHRHLLTSSRSKPNLFPTKSLDKTS